MTEVFLDEKVWMRRRDKKTFLIAHMADLTQTDKTIEPGSPLSESFDSAVDTGVLKDWLESELLSNGFMMVGFVNLDLLSDSPTWQQAQQDLDAWLDSGNHADMDWMARYRDIRKNPKALMEGAKTAVVVALNYAQEEPEEQRDESSLKVSTYAWGKDYHKVIRRRLASLLKRFQSAFPQVGIEGRAMTDSAPVLEKALAIEAGLGWQGKNTLVIHPEHGSQFFIGELLLNIYLPVQAATFTDHCGRCQRCIDACPTDALGGVELGEAPRVLDSRRCISYWTIESAADVFPEDVQKNLQGWVFGCDICQQVCPWNQRFSAVTDDPAFEPRVWASSSNIESLVPLSLSRFQELFQNSPIRRAGQKRFVRNVESARL